MWFCVVNEVMNPSTGLQRTSGFLQCTLLKRIFPSGSENAQLTRLRRACPGSERTSDGYIDRPIITPFLRESPKAIPAEMGASGQRRFGSHHLSLRRDKPETEAKLVKLIACRGFKPDDLCKLCYRDS